MKPMTLKDEKMMQLDRLRDRLQEEKHQQELRLKGTVEREMEMIKNDDKIGEETKAGLLKDLEGKMEMLLTEIDASVEDVMEKATAEMQEVVEKLEKQVEQDEGMSLMDGIAQMQQMELDGLGLETEQKLTAGKMLLEKGIDLNKDMLKKRMDARNANAEKKLREEASEDDDFDIDQEEQDLLDEMGEGDDWWWEDTLTRAVVAENENGKSEWDVLEAEQKRLKQAMKRRQQEER